MRRTGGFPKRYTLGEEVMNAVTHGLGTILAVAGATLLIASSALQGDPYKLGSSIVYGVSLTLLYLMSTVYHGVASSRAKEILRIFDHCSIFLLIAGTYTPVCMIVLGDETGWKLLALVWGIAIAGILIKGFWITCPKWFSSLLYIAMGWVCVLAFTRILQALPRAGFGWLLAGGLIYTAGGVIYALKLPIFNSKHKHFGSHEIFHLFVMGGSMCHYIMMYQFVA